MLVPDEAIITKQSVKEVLEYMRRNTFAAVETTEDAENWYTAHLQEVGAKTLLADGGQILTCMTCLTDEIERVSRAVDSAYSAPRLRSACVDSMAGDLDQTHVAALRRWFEGELGRAIVRLEAAQSRQNPQAVLERGSALLGLMPSSRRHLLEELVVASHTAELMTALTIGTAIAVQQGAASVSPQGPAVSLRELKESFYSQRHEMMRGASAMSLTMFAATYESLRDADLQAYTGFFKSAAGSHFLHVRTQAFESALLNAASQLGSALAESRKQKGT